MATKKCEECGKQNDHKESCSLYIDPECEKCGYGFGLHSKHCPYDKDFEKTKKSLLDSKNSKSIFCEECGEVFLLHKSDCSIGIKEKTQK